jgi:hypothetical protein
VVDAALERRIQNSIQPSTPTATTAAMPSTLSWTTSGSLPTVVTTATPTPIDSASAAATPAHTPGRASRRSIFTRYAATIPTMSAASRPSRSAMKNAAVILEVAPWCGALGVDRRPPARCGKVA